MTKDTKEKIEKTKKVKKVKKTINDNIVQEDIKKEEKIVKEEKKEKNDKVKNDNKYSSRDVILILVLTLIFGLLLGRFLVKKNDSDVKKIKEVDKVYKDVIENHYGEIDETQMRSSIISGIVVGLNDKYAYYSEDKTGILNYNESINGTFIGLGVQITTNENGEIYVMEVYDDSPAKRAGIEVNDIILKLDGESYNVNNFNDLPYEIKTSKLSDSKELELSRNGEIIKVNIQLEKVDVKSVSYYSKESNGSKVGIITINNFANNTYDQFVNAYEELKKEKIEALVIDVRNNSEGTLENAKKIASLFLAKDSVIYQINDGKEVKKIKSDDDRVITLRTALVIDGTTVSTAEMLASALNENLNCQLIGSKTYGKGYMQDVIKLANGKYFAHTTSEWVTSKKMPVEGIGISPTIEIKCEEEKCENDVQLEKAIEIISSKMGQV